MTCSTMAGQVGSGRSLLSELLGVYRRLSSRPPKGTGPCVRGLPAPAPETLFKCFSPSAQVLGSGAGLRPELQTCVCLPLGFEKYFPDAQKPVKNSEAEAASKGRVLLTPTDTY